MAARRPHGRTRHPDDPVDCSYTNNGGKQAGWFRGARGVKKECPRPAFAEAATRGQAGAADTNCMAKSDKLYDRSDKLYDRDITLVGKRDRAPRYLI